MRTPRVCVRLESIQIHVDFLEPLFAERHIYKRDGANILVCHGKRFPEYPDESAALATP